MIENVADNPQTGAVVLFDNAKIDNDDSQFGGKS